MNSTRKNIFSSFNQFPYFTKEALHVSVNRLDMLPGTFNSYIYKGLKEGQIISLKRGYYVTRVFYEINKTKTDYTFFLANIFLEPSYISLETALQHYGLYAEAMPYALKSVTTKLPRSITNRLGVFSYHNITERLFAGFKIIKGEFTFAIALPHKAVFDYLYYYTHGFTRNVHPDLLEVLRIDTDELQSDEKNKLLELIATFTSVKIHL